jgi:hypothetical protein
VLPLFSLFFAATLPLPHNPLPLVNRYSENRAWADPQANNPLPTFLGIDGTAIFSRMAPNMLSFNFLLFSLALFPHWSMKVMAIKSDKEVRWANHTHTHTHTHTHLHTHTFTHTHIYTHTHSHTHTHTHTHTHLHTHTHTHTHTLTHSHSLAHSLIPRTHSLTPVTDPKSGLPSWCCRSAVHGRSSQ